MDVVGCKAGYDASRKEDGDEPWFFSWQVAGRDMGGTEEEVDNDVATDMKEYAKTYKRKEGILYYTSYKIHGKEMTYRNYKKSEKKLLGGEKMITIKEHKNTSTNRKSYLK